MGYTIDLEADDLRCRSEADARRAVAVIENGSWIHPYHLQVSVTCRSNPPCDDAWQLEVDHFQGDHWNEDEARRVWLAIAPFMVDGAVIEFQGEDSERWRIRWHEGHVFEEYITDIVWAVNQEITATKENA